VPLQWVARLEELPAARLERADDRWLVQYRGGLLPVVPASPGLQPDARDPRPLVVLADGERTFGLAVDRIHDIVESRVVIETESSRPGIVGAAIVAGRATEVLDVDYWLMDAGRETQEAA
jgi:two-component system chemotaxis sensor kinase CheA